MCLKIKDNNYSLRSNTEEKAARQSWKKRVSAVQLISTLISVIVKLRLLVVVVIMEGPKEDVHSQYGLKHNNKSTYRAQ